MNASSKNRRKQPTARLPLALVIARYFLYLFALLVCTWGCLLLGLVALANTNCIYPANYGEYHIQEVTEALAAQDSFDDAAIPSPYRFALISADGEVVSSDMPQAWLDSAHDIAVDAQGGIEYRGLLADATLYRTVQMADGSACVLAYQLMPTFADKSLRDALPNPQNLMTLAGVAASAAVIAAVAIRASRVISRKMRPLQEAAENIKRENLDFSVGRSNVRQIDNVLQSMEDMRAALKETLEARWQAEAAQRTQIAALAHDLKTPLSVVRANAEFASEEAREIAECMRFSCGSPNGPDAASPESVPLKAGFGPSASQAATTGCDKAEGVAGTAGSASDPARNALCEALDDIACAAEDAAAGSVRLDGYVRLLIDASSGVASGVSLANHTARDLADALRDACAAICHARGLALEFCTPDADVCVAADAAALSRAVENLAANAADHAPRESTLHVAIGVHAAAEALGGTSEGGSRQPRSNAHDGGCEGAQDGASGNAVLRIEVRDEGPGFTPAALAHGTERFFQDDAARQGDGHYGLGLAIASDIARAHGGALSLENADAGGAEAAIEIPARCDALAKAREPEAFAIASAPSAADA